MNNLNQNGCSLIIKPHKNDEKLMFIDDFNIIDEKLAILLCTINKKINLMKVNFFFNKNNLIFLRIYNNNNNLYEIASFNSNYIFKTEFLIKITNYNNYDINTIKDILFKYFYNNDII